MLILVNSENNMELDEVDIAVEYSDSFFNIEKWNYSIGAIYYNFPHKKSSETTEVYAGL